MNGGRYASVIWVYIIFPLVGAILAAILFKLHVYLDNRALKQDVIANEGGAAGAPVVAV